MPWIIPNGAGGGSGRTGAAAAGGAARLPFRDTRLSPVSVTGEDEAGEGRTVPGGPPYW